MPECQTRDQRVQDEEDGEYMYWRDILLAPVIYGWPTIPYHVWVRTHTDPAFRNETGMTSESIGFYDIGEP